jgi:hypothetical protein
MDMEDDDAFLYGEEASSPPKQVSEAPAVKAPAVEAKPTEPTRSSFIPLLDVCII